LKKDKAKGNKNQSFILGAAILSFCLLVVKVIGMLYKVSLSRLYGEVGAGLLNNAYELYTPLFTLASAGFPIAVSRMVSENMSKGRYRDIRRIKSVAVPFFIISGIICFLLMILFSFFLCTNNKRSGFFRFHAGACSGYLFWLFSVGLPRIL